MEQRLIDANALKKAINDNGCRHSHYFDIFDVIDNAPTVDTTFREVVAYECGQKSVEERPKGEWIPVKYRPLTTEERIEFAKHYGIEYCDTVDEKAVDCPMPEDGQEILVSTKWGVCTDIADNDIDGEGFVVYGLEGNGDWEGIDAWMPLPEPYTRGEV